MKTLNEMLRTYMNIDASSNITDLDVYGVLVEDLTSAEFMSSTV